MRRDPELLRAFCRDADETAFAELVERHLPVVYGAALRVLGGDAHAAQDVAQVAFTALARQARKLEDRESVAAWLHTVARNAAVQRVRAEVRRRQREDAAASMNDPEPTENLEWEHVRPLVDEALGSLGEPDRDAVLLRYFAGLSYAEVGARLELGADAARMRTDRALEKLRTALAKRGVTSTAGLLGGVLASHVTSAAPATLAATVTSAALGALVPGGGVVASTAGLTLMTKVQLAAVGVVLGVLAVFVGQQTIVNGKLECALVAERARCEEWRTRGLALATAAAERDASAKRAAASVAPVNDQIAWPPPMTADEAEKAVRMQRVMLDRPYAALFRRLRLPPEKLDALKDLLAERQLTRNRTALAAQRSGLALRQEASEQLREMVDAGWEGPIRALLGEDGLASFREFEADVGMRPILSYFEQGLRFSATPLSDAQMDQLARLALARSVSLPDTGGYWKQLVMPDELIREASAFLEPTQLERLRAQQAAWAAKNRMRELHREAAKLGKLDLTSQSAKDYPRPAKNGG